MPVISHEFELIAPAPTRRPGQLVEQHPRLALRRPPTKPSGLDRGAVCELGLLPGKALVVFGPPKVVDQIVPRLRSESTNLIIQRTDDGLDTLCDFTQSVSCAYILCPAGCVPGGLKLPATIMDSRSVRRGQRRRLEPRDRPRNRGAAHSPVLNRG